ncbi:MAG: dihydroorotate dehydrogenase electron transfer subunit [Candidatus Methanosuratincola sp.]|jgi:dihydroorotate dehydrogenase electron transfer subunit
MGVEFTHAEVINNYEVSGGFWIIEIHAPKISRSSSPGQFVMIQTSSAVSFDPLLPRAYSMARRTESTLLFIYRVIGRGTTLLSLKRPGDRLYIWGPLGRGFRIEEGEAVLIGGGTGIAPLIDLGEELAQRGRPFRLVCGGRTKEDLKFMERFGNIEYTPYTEDGSLGKKGLVTLYLEGGDLSPNSIIYSCGPMGMLRRIGEIAIAKGLRCQLSVEAPMACGLGTCLGCAVERRDGGYFKACTDGPVFEAKEVVI